MFVAVATDDPQSIDEMKVQFVLDMEGNVAAVHALLEPAVPAIVFARKPDARLLDPAFLSTLVGKYKLDSVVVQVLLQGSTLVVTLPGQRHELEPRVGLMFGLRGVGGYAAEFVLDAAGTPVMLRFHQPDGVHEAKRE